MTTATREQTRETYSRNAAEYDRVRLEDQRGLLLSEHDRRIFRELLPAGASRILEVGAGTGRFTVEALDRGYSLVATDINEPMLERLRERLEQSGLSGRCKVEAQDVFNLTYAPGQFDLIFSVHVIPRFLTWEDQSAAITSIARVLAPGGMLLFNYRNRRSFYNLFYRGHAATPAQIEGVLKECGLRVTQRRGKWLLNKSLLTKLPMPLCRALATVDRALVRFWPAGAWDVFVLAVKHPDAAPAADAR